MHVCVQTAIEQLDEAEKSRPTGGEGYVSINVALNDPDEYVFPALDECDVNWTLPLAQFKHLHKKSDLIKKTRERHIVEEAKA